MSGPTGVRQNHEANVSRSPQPTRRIYTLIEHLFVQGVFLHLANRQNLRVYEPVRSQRSNLFAVAGSNKSFDDGLPLDMISESSYAATQCNRETTAHQLENNFVSGVGQEVQSSGSDGC